ncbi:hypothetical protein ACFOSV_06140 [Algoriphagus namhaensis]|uniref:Uncharacterized protein n=1 Tax=Algoriphagus namhaensis TaxID=915353 RepID=A0ABV8AQ63_9BACT
MKFQNTGYYYLGFLIMTFIGFWPSYFSKFFDGTAEFNQYFHFHSLTAILWVAMLVIQPILIQSKKYELHKAVGKFSYLLVPILFVSVALLANNRIDPELEFVGPEVWIPFKDLIIFSLGFGIAITFKNSMPIHARGMIVAGMALIEPVMARVMFNVLEIQGLTGYLSAISVDYIILVVLIILERKETKGRWVFPLALATFLFIHAVVLFKINPEFWESFARWFVTLPLT